MVQCKECHSTGHNHKKDRCEFKAHANLIRGKGANAKGSTEALLHMKAPRNHTMDFTQKTIESRFNLLPGPTPKLPPPPKAYFESDPKKEFALEDDDVLGYSRLFGILPNPNHSNPLEQLRSLVNSELDKKRTRSQFGLVVRSSGIPLMCPGEEGGGIDHLEMSGFIDKHGKCGDVLEFLNQKCKYQECTETIGWRPYPKAPPPPPS